VPVQAEAGTRRPPTSTSRRARPASGTRGSIRCARASTRLGGSPGPGRRTAVLYAPDDTADQRHAQIVKANLNAIGIDVQIKILSHAVLFQRLGRKGEPYDLALTRWYADYADPVTFLGFFDPRQGPANPSQSTNDSYFHEPGYTRRLAAAERLPPPKRYVAYGRLESDLARNAAPWAAIGNPVAQDFFSARIGCQVFHPCTA
jgi:ABC-type oligopeptide transport system substrate-binding subunit